MTFMWTTVSTPACVMILAIIGFRMSARTNSTLPMSCGGGMTSMPMTRPTLGSAVSSGRSGHRDSGNPGHQDHVRHEQPLRRGLHATPGA